MAEYGDTTGDGGAGYEEPTGYGPETPYEAPPVYEAESAYEPTPPAEPPAPSYEPPPAYEEAAVYEEVPPAEPPSPSYEETVPEVPSLDETSTYDTHVAPEPAEGPAAYDQQAFEDPTQAPPPPEPASQAELEEVAQEEFPAEQTVLYEAEYAAPDVPAPPLEGPTDYGPHTDPTSDRQTPPPTDPALPSEVQAEAMVVDPALAELEQALTPGELVPSEAPFAPGAEAVPTPLMPAAPQPGLAPFLRPGQPMEPFVFEGDMAHWCQPGLPAEWEAWSPPSAPAQEVETDSGYSEEWGTLQPGWAIEGQAPFEVTEPERPLSSVIGPGHANDIYWADQGNTQYCALYSVRSIISELYGVQADPQEVVTRAAQNGWLEYDANGQVEGVMSDNIDDILASYGVPSRATSGEEGAWQGLNDALVNNQRVVLSLDSKEVDQGTNVGDVVGGLDSDHAIAVTGIDYGRGVVIVNDSARSAGLEIPLDVFYESWRDSNFSMTITDIAAPGGGQASPPAGAEQPVEGAPGFALLGMTLTPGLAQDAAGSVGSASTDFDTRDGGSAIESATALAGLPAAPVDSVGDWWGTAAPIVECCAPMPAVSETGAVPGAPLNFVQQGGAASALPGVDANGDGVDDFVGLDANQDGRIDTWVADTTASGTGDTMYVDTDGDGLPDAVSSDPNGTGEWSAPVLLSSLTALPGQASSAQSPIPPGQPGTPSTEPAPATSEGQGASEMTPEQARAVLADYTADAHPLDRLYAMAAEKNDQMSMQAIQNIYKSQNEAISVWTRPDDDDDDY